MVPWVSHCTGIKSTAVGLLSPAKFGPTSLGWLKVEVMEYNDGIDHT